MGCGSDPIACCPAAEIARLTAGSNGALDLAVTEWAVAKLMAGGSDPVITKAPEGAWTSMITDKALAQ